MNIEINRRSVIEYIWTSEQSVHTYNLHFGDGHKYIFVIVVLVRMFVFVWEIDEESVCACGFKWDMHMCSWVWYMHLSNHSNGISNATRRTSYNRHSLHSVVWREALLNTVDDTSVDASGENKAHIDDDEYLTSIKTICIHTSKLLVHTHTNTHAHKYICTNTHIKTQNHHRNTRTNTHTHTTYKYTYTNRSTHKHT